MPVKILPIDAVKKMQGMWPDYDFSKFIYEGSYKESIVVCPTHGEVSRTFKNVTRKWGHACGKCTSNVKRDNDLFLTELKKLYPETWHLCDYSKMEYTNAQSVVIITCREHGEFTCKACTLTLNPGPYLCTKCNIRKRSEKQTRTTTEFIDIASKIHPGKDTFENVNYVSSEDPVEMTCVTHGPYFTSPKGYIQGKRCAHCARTRKSGPELEIFEYIKTIHPNCVNRVRPLEDSRLELDIFLPELGLGIEYNGLYFHRDGDELADKYSGKMASKTSALIKTELFSKIGIRLVHIFEDEWLEKKDLVKAKLASLLGKSDRVFARKCRVVEVPEATLKHFENTFHIQGHALGAKHRYGLEWDGELICCMSFSTLRFEEKAEDSYELLRFSSRVTVVGGFTKLLTHFVRQVKPVKIVSYSDKRWSVGNVYLKAGFTLEKTSPPGYFWCRGRKRFNRVVFQRHKLNFMFQEDYPKEMTESDIMYYNNYFKVHDCGQDKWVLNIPGK